MKDLTEKQSEVLAFLRSYYAEYDRLPSTRDIARHFTMWQTVAYGHLSAIEKKGHIESVCPHGSRSFYRFTRHEPAQPH